MIQVCRWALVLLDFGFVHLMDGVGLSADVDFLFWKFLRVG